MSDDRFIPARHTSLPITEGLGRFMDAAYHAYKEPIVYRVNDRAFVIPYGVTQEGVLVEYQNADGDWESPDEVQE